MQDSWKVEPYFKLTDAAGKEYGLHGVPFHVQITGKVQRGWRAFTYQSNGSTVGQIFADESEAIAYAAKANARQQYDAKAAAFYREYAATHQPYNAESALAACESTLGGRP